MAIDVRAPLSSAAAALVLNLSWHDTRPTSVSYLWFYAIRLHFEVNTALRIGFSLSNFYSSTDSLLAFFLSLLIHKH